MKKLLLAVAFCLSFSAFSQQNTGFNQTESGLNYQFLKDVPGRTAALGDVIKINFKMMTSTDSILRDTWKEPNPAISQAQAPVFKGSPEEAFLMMSQGDSAVFLVSADSLFEKAIRQPLPPFIEKGSFLKFLIKMEGLQSMEEFQAMKAKESEEMIALEDATIQEYLLANNLNGVKQASGLYYVQLTPGTGAKAEPGKTASVHYTGKLLNGQEFDSSRTRGPFEFAIGRGQVIQGWEQGVALMSIGEKGILILPSALGYGPRGAGGAIPPNSILVFEIELLDLK
jgi:peptidylprolyl isomerase